MLFETNNCHMILSHIENDYFFDVTIILENKFLERMECTINMIDFNSISESPLINKFNCRIIKPNGNSECIGYHLEIPFDLFLGKCSPNGETLVASFFINIQIMGMGASDKIKKKLVKDIL
jgi:hypothetical protein